MEMITAGGRRTLPPVPRSSLTPAPTRDTCPPVLRRPPVPPPARAVPETAPRPSRRAAHRDDPGQAFVSALRAAAPDLAAAAESVTAVVAEAVPPARHRRARCRVVLLAADGTQTAVTFLGAAGAPTAGTAAVFTAGVTDWLRAGGDLGGGWAVPDPSATRGVAVDVTAWRASR